jgi:hypothetical protein
VIPGCANARDLGGLRTRDGRMVRRGALFRSGAPDASWEAVRAQGIVTVIDLRNADERGAAGAGSVSLPLDGIEDTAFWDQWTSRVEFGTPLYYAPFLEHFPGRAAAVVAAIAGAPPGAVLFHCQGGRDRTGLIAMLVLAALGVADEDIAAEYALSVPDETAEAFYAELGETPEAVALEFLRGLDLDAHLRGVDVAALRARLLEP